jgi:hypothetical protein
MVKNPTISWWPRCALLAAILLCTAATAGAAPFNGAIYTTDVTCSGVNINLFANRDDVYLDGGPAGQNAGSGLPDGEYYVKVTAPDGTLLGTSIGSGDETPVLVVDGKFDVCYQLSAIVIKASDSTPGYDETTNNGGEYKVWVSPDAEFDAQKTDNFKVLPDTSPAILNVGKFYDANVNGLNDDGQPITGWQVRIQDGIDYIRYTPVSIALAPDDYTVTESTPIENNWIATTPTSVAVTLEEGGTASVEFGNVCLGGGGGHTLGYWSNKNGQATMNDGGTLNPELAMLSALHLRNASGTDFDPANYAAFRNWLLSANATNMAYMLSAQLSAMALNVEAGFVSGGAIVYSPVLGFVSINGLMAAADAQLAADGSTPAGDANRDAQEALKNALDAANNNQNFVQGQPCPFSFAQ